MADLAFSVRYVDGSRGCVRAIFGKTADDAVARWYAAGCSRAGRLLRLADGKDLGEVTRTAAGPKVGA